MTYIAFEGIDGSGKTTQFNIQSHRLIIERGQEQVCVCKFNSRNNFFGNLVEKAYKNKPCDFIDNIIKRDMVRETLCALGARVNLHRTPDLDKPIILSDRSVVTAFAYNYRKISEKYLSLIEPSFYPDVVIFMDIIPELGMERANIRKSKKSSEKRT